MRRFALGTLGLRRGSCPSRAPASLVAGRRVRRRPPPRRPPCPPPAASLVSAGPSCPRRPCVVRARVNALGVPRRDGDGSLPRKRAVAVSSVVRVAARRRRIFFASSHVFRGGPRAAAFARRSRRRGGAAPPRLLGARGPFPRALRGHVSERDPFAVPRPVHQQVFADEPVGEPSVHHPPSYGPCTTPWRWRRDDPGGDGHGKARGRDGFVRSETREVRRDARDEVVRSRRGPSGRSGSPADPRAGDADARAREPPTTREGVRSLAARDATSRRPIAHLQIDVVVQVPIVGGRHRDSSGATVGALRYGVRSTSQ